MPEVGTLNIECATCGLPLEIPINAEMAVDKSGHPFVDTYADVAGLWLHAWDQHDDGLPND